MTSQRVFVILGFVAAAVILGLGGETEMASAALGIAGGAVLPAKQR